MKMPSLTKYSSEDLKEIPEKIKKIITDYYSTFTIIYSALNRNLNGDNLDVQYKDLTVVNTAFPVTFDYTTHARPQGLTMIYCHEVSGNHVIPAAALYLDWQMDGGKKIRLNALVGAVAGTQYNIRLRIE